MIMMSMLTMIKLVVMMETVIIMVMMMTDMGFVTSDVEKTVKVLVKLTRRQNAYTFFSMIFEQCNPLVS